MPPRAIMLIALVCAVCAGAPALAGAASGGTPSQAITDCNDHGKLTQQYSPTVLRNALAQLPSDVREYTDCFDVIERQLFKQLQSAKTGTPTGATSSSGSSFLPTWLIVVIVVLALAAITFGALAIRRRGGGPGDPGAGAPPGAGGAPPGPGGAPPGPGGAPPGPGGAPPGGGPDPGGPGST